MPEEASQTYLMNQTRVFTCLRSTGCHFLCGKKAFVMPRAKRGLLAYSGLNAMNLIFFFQLFGHIVVMPWMLAYARGSILDPSHTSIQFFDTSQEAMVVTPYAATQQTICHVKRCPLGRLLLKNEPIDT